MNTEASKEKESSLEVKVDMINFERRQRQFLNELAMKRIQVQDLKKELDAANLKIHELTTALDLAKSTNEDHQYNLNLALTNARFFEDQLQAKRDYVTKTRLQQESAATERESLKGLLQKSEIQNYNLLQELNELKAQHDCDFAYQKKLLDEDARIRRKIEEVTKAFQELKVDENELMRLSAKVQDSENIQKTAAFYQGELYKCRENYVKLEEKFIVVNAALERYQELAKNNEKLFHLNQETEIIINQWKKESQWFNEQRSLQNEIIENLTSSLKAEKQSNTKLCVHENELIMKNKKLEEEIETLNAKFPSLPQPKEVLPKTEIL